MLRPRPSTGRHAITRAATGESPQCDTARGFAAEPQERRRICRRRTNEATAPDLSCNLRFRFVVVLQKNIGGRQ
jgi:hypothetical protein